jgi:metal-responsive CopG/Arc/MetJ family transcriptional regulator
MFHDITITVRIEKHLYRRMNMISKRDWHLMDSNSDLIRIAVIKYLKERESMTKKQLLKEKREIVLLEDSKNE